MSLMNVDFDADLFISHDHLAESDLKAMYEKKGAICTMIHGYKRSPIMSIARCPWNIPQSNIKTFCEYSSVRKTIYQEENIIDFLYTPVQDDDGFVYKNVYCAQCNGVRHPVTWLTKLDCNDMQPLEVSDGREKIFIMEEYTDKHLGCTRWLRPWHLHMIHECDSSEVKEISGMRRHQSRTGDGRDEDYSPFPLSFSILMNFGFDGKTHILFSTSPDEQFASQVCPQGQLYDPVNVKCRNISCQEGYDLVENTCIRKESYESDTTSTDIDNLKDIGETVQVILTIKNVSCGEMVLLMIPSLEEILEYNLAQRFNISKDRIANLTVSVVNASASANSTEKEIIEIHRFTTPKPSKLSPNIHSPKELLDLQSAQTDASKDEKKYTSPDKMYEGNRERPETFDEPESQFNTNTRYNVSAVNDTNTRATSVKHSSSDVQNSKQFHPNESVLSESLDKAVNSHTNFPSEEPDLDNFDFLCENVNVRVSFLLKPAQENKAMVEKSVQNVVQKMTDLISSNSFSLTINGTDFQVDGLENPPSPTPMDLFCMKGEFASFSDDEFEVVRGYDSDRKENLTLVKINATGQEFRPGEYDLTVMVDGMVGNLTRTKVTSFVFVCIMPKITDEECGRILLGKSEYTMFVNQTVEFAGKLFNRSQYEYDNQETNSIKICPDWSNAQTVKTRWAMVCGDDLLKLTAVESYLTFVLGLLSLISMLTVLITYMLFEKLRNLPGTNTMNLTTSLFLGEMVFIASGSAKPHEVWLCSAVGMLLHYLFLASFFWMNVMAYDVFRTFAKKCILTRIRAKKKFLPRYALYAWGSPLLIVLVCAVFDYSDIIPGVKIGYGRHSTTSGSVANSEPQIGNSSTPVTSDTSHLYSFGCWIQQPVASMVAFGGPMVLIIIVNIGMFTRTIICIRASTKMTQTSVRRSSLSHMAGHDDVMLYIRMSTVMGFTWIFGLASSIVSAFSGEPSRTICIVLHLFGILFIVFNCSQGLFIFFAFVFNRRVLGLYRGLVQTIKRSANRECPISASLSRTTLTANLSQSSVSHIT